MGYRRTNTLPLSEKAVGIAAVKIGTVPANVCEGQMSFRNRGSTNIVVGVGSSVPTLGSYYIYLAAGDGFSEEGIIPGDVSALSDAAGGILSANISFSVRP